MAYVLFALLMFVASVITHILFCRHTTKSGLHAMAYVFMAVFFMGVYIAGVYCLGQKHVLDPHSLWGLPFKITSAMIFIFLVPAYLCFYTLTQLMSPSKKILMTVSLQGNLSRAQILRCVQEEEFIDTRLSDLCVSGCVKLINGRYHLTPEGKKIAMVLNAMQGILGRGMGG